MRMVLVLTVQYNMHLRHVDLTNAFLHEDYQGLKPVYVQSLPPFSNPRHKQSHTVWQVMKIFMAFVKRRRFYVKGVYKFLLAHGYTQLQSDSSVFIRYDGTHILIIALTIDDLLIATTCLGMYRVLIRQLRTRYTVKELGEATQVIGWNITRCHKLGTLHISLPRMTQEFIDLVRMDGAKSSPTPYVSHVSMHERTDNEAPLTSNKFPYLSALGKLRYIVDSCRPDLAYIAGILARHAASPTRRH